MLGNRLFNFFMSPDDASMPSSRGPSMSKTTTMPAMVTVGLDEAIIDWNPGAESLFGWSAAEAQGQRLTMIVPTERRAEISQLLESVKQGRPVHEYDTQWIRKSGSPIDTVVTFQPVTDNVQRVTGISLLARDVSEPKKMENALRLVQKELRDYAETMIGFRKMQEDLAAAQRIARLGSWEWEMRENRLRWSETLPPLLGLELAVKEMNYDDFLAFLAPDVRDVIRQTLQECLNMGSSFSVDRRVELKNGERRWVHVQGDLFFDDQKRPVRMEGTVQDITERKNTEQVLRQSEAKFQALLASSLIGIVVGEVSGKIVEANDTFLKMMGYTRQDLLSGAMAGFSFMPLTPASDGAASIDGNGVDPVEKTFVRKDGTSLPVLVGATLLKENPNQFVGFLLDLTEHKKIENQRIQLAQEHEKRNTAEQAQQRSNFLAQASLLLSSSLDYEDTLKRLTRLLTISLADWCVVTLTDDQTTIARLFMSHPEPSSEKMVNSFLQRYVGTHVRDHLIARVIATGKAEIVDVPEEAFKRSFYDSTHIEMVRTLGCESMMLLPLVVRGRIFGAIEFVNTDAQHAYTPDDLLLAEEVCHYASVAVENARLYTETLRAKESINKSERELSDFFSNAPVGLHWAGPDGTIQKANRAELEMLGYKEDEYVGHFLAEFHADPQVANDIMARLKKGEELQNYEARLVCSDGSLKDVLISASALWDNDQFVHSRSFVRDVTAIKQAEAAARSLAVIVESSDDAILSKTLDGIITSWNKSAERLYGYTASEMVGRSVSVLIPPDRPDELSRLLDRLKNNQKIEHFETVRMRKDGTFVDVSLTISVMRDAAGRPMGASTIARNITERKRYEEGLARARDAAIASDRMKSEFVANVSHEIRTPMNGIIGMTSLLLNTKLQPKQRDFAETIRSSSDALLSIVNDILDFSKIEAGKMSLEVEEFDLVQLMESTVDFLAPRAHFKGLELMHVVAHDVPTFLKGDPGRIRQILTNFIGNAIKFTEKGNVVLRATKDSETESHVVLQLSVTDTGIGIPREWQSQLFQPFSQVDSSASRKFGGTGLGLAISKRFVDLMGGEIGVSSSPGEGSTFWCLLTLEKQKKTVEVAPEMNQKQAKLRVLVVDENPTHREAVVHQLNAWKGCVTECAADSADALEILRQDARRGNPFQVVLINQQNTSEDALVLAKKIKTNRSFSVNKVALMVMVNQPVDAQEMREAGVGTTLTKPIKPAALLDCLLPVLRKSARGASPTTATQEVKPRRRRAHILVVEDNSVNQKVMLQQLDNLGYSADAVGNGLEAIQALEHVPYDLVLMDCQMPEMDGYAATAMIRKREGKGVHLPIIAMTAHVMSGDREKCLAAGMDDYIPKPIKNENLKATLARWDEGPSAPVRPAEEAAAASSDPAQDPMNDPRFVRRISRLFLQETPKYLQAMHDSLKKQDAQAMYIAAHTLAGSCCIVGTKEIKTLCRQLEEKAQAKKLRGVDKILAELDQEFTVVKKTLDVGSRRGHHENSHRG